MTVVVAQPEMTWQKVTHDSTVAWVVYAFRLIGTDLSGALPDAIYVDRSSVEPHFERESGALP